MSKPAANTLATHEKTSSLLNRIAAEFKGEKTKLGLLLYRLRRRSFGGLLFFLAILSLIPGISMFAGAVMLFLSVQLCYGAKAPKVPRFIGEYGIRTQHLVATLNRTATQIERIESYIRPRWIWFTQAPILLLLGLVIFCLSILIMIPLPFTNLLPAFAILLMALGLLERDGVLIVVGLLLSAICFVLGRYVVEVAIHSFVAVT